MRGTLRIREDIIGVDLRFVVELRIDAGGRATVLNGQVEPARLRDAVLAALARSRWDAARNAAGDRVTVTVSFTGGT